MKRRQFNDGRYNTETPYLEGDDLPHGTQIIYQDGGPKYSIEKYLPVWHYQNIVEILATEGYEQLVNPDPRG